MNRIIRSGIDVAIPNNAGRINPEGEEIATGIKVTKNKINIVGQKATEKLIPIQSEPQLPCLELIGIQLDSLLRKRSLKKPNKNNPIKIIMGPIIFRNPEKKIVLFDLKSFPIHQNKRPSKENAITFPAMKKNTSVHFILDWILLVPYIVMALILVVSWQGASDPINPNINATKTGKFIKLSTML